MACQRVNYHQRLSLAGGGRGVHGAAAWAAAGNLEALNEYAAGKGLHHNELFWAVAQAVLEMAAVKSRKRTLLEAVVAWGRGKAPEQEQHEQTRLL